MKNDIIFKLGIDEETGETVAMLTPCLLEGIIFSYLDLYDETDRIGGLSPKAQKGHDKWTALTALAVMEGIIKVRIPKEDVE